MAYLLIWFAIVSLLDLVLSGFFLSQELEMNPIAAWIWATFGFGGVIVFKTTVCALYCIAAQKLAKSYKNVVLRAMMVVNVVITLACLSFLLI